MATIYDKSVAKLFREMVAELKPGPETILTKEQIVTWFKNRYPKIKRGTIDCHCIRLSTNAQSRIHYGAGSPDDLFFQLGTGRYRLYAAMTDPAPIYELGDQPVTVLPETESTAQQFAYEKDLQAFLAKNLKLIEEGLSLYRDEEDERIVGVEYPAGDRFIDILAVDARGNFVVIELKVSRGYDRVVGQLLRYIGWVRQNLVQNGQEVRGVIIAREISDDLKLATIDLPHVALMEYELSVTLKKAVGKSGWAS